MKSRYDIRVWSEYVYRLLNAKGVRPTVNAAFCRLLATNQDVAEVIGVDENRRGRLKWLVLNMWALVDVVPKLQRQRKEISKLVQGQIGTFGQLRKSQLQKQIDSVAQQHQLDRTEKILVNLWIRKRRDNMVRELWQILQQSHYRRAEILAILTGVPVIEVRGRLRCKIFSGLLSAFDRQEGELQGIIEQKQRTLPLFWTNTETQPLSTSEAATANMATVDFAHN